ncbi:hypothetical protein MLD38_016947 [Melastoma candidum]|uniref:Uncharacterized protein n=1 Tax=Melastoma candidum TaxID=119954 RepID=A0ACB9QP38_9MYRT|nr:hypothetical protein MLD38_016947 [Melastoma candidum]
MGTTTCYDQDLVNLEATELRLGLPGRHQPRDNHPMKASTSSNKRSLDETRGEDEEEDVEGGAKVAFSKAQIVGWPPIRSFRKNITVHPKSKMGREESSSSSEASGIYLKVSMDGAPYLRKIHLGSYKGYDQLLAALQTMFRITIGQYSEREGYEGSEYAPTYEDKDGDWMLVGDVPWEMFVTTCKRLRIMKGAEARGLGCGI